MAVYQRARPPAILPGIAARLGAIEPVAGAGRRPRRTMTVRARRRTDRTAALIGAVVLAFMLAFFSLAQTVAVSATSFEIDRLRTDGARLESRLRDVASDLNRLGSEPAVRKLAIDLGLGQLADPLVLPAR